MWQALTTMSYPSIYKTVFTGLLVMIFQSLRNEQGVSGLAQGFFQWLQIK